MPNQSDTVPSFDPYTLPSFNDPYTLPKINWEEFDRDQGDREVADTPKIDLTPVDTTPITSAPPLPTEEQIDGFKPLMVVTILALGLIGISFLQGSKTISTEIQTAQPQVQAATVVTTETVEKESTIAPQKPLPMPMPERDPDKVQLNLMLLSHFNNAKEPLNQLVEARASWFRLQAQQLAERNPQSYPMYLAGQLERVNLGLANQVKLNQTTLVGTEEQTRVASALLIDSQAIALEQIRWKVANGEMTDIPEELRSRLMPSSTSPYIQIASFARDSDNIAYLNKLNLLADREQEVKRLASMEAQNLKNAQKLPVPKREAKK